jgi:tetratricopeptide (TPR) repeat protein
MPFDSPLCFVLMPCGSKADPSGGPNINFDPIYEQAVKPAIEEAGMEPLRADDERTGDTIHKPMFERFLLCDFAVADLTTCNPNVFYELGVRHAARPATTLAIFAANQRVPFDISYLRALPYVLGPNNSVTPQEANLVRNSLAARLVELRKAAVDGDAKDSPVFQLLNDYRAPDIARLKTDSFRDRVRYSNEHKRALAIARANGDATEMERIEKSLEPLDETEVGVLIDLLLSYRAVRAWENMIRLYDRMSASLQRSVMVREQHAFALNRLGRWQEAVTILEQVVAEQGPSSETLSILGRVYKDLWVKAEKSGNAFLAEGHLRKAVDCYVRGFETDWRDAYPGINAVTLLDIQGNPGSESKKAELLPVVMFAVRQRLKSAKPDYWDYATLLELAVLQSAEEEVRLTLSDALSHIREEWEAETTANNLALISAARKKRGLNQPWLDDVISFLRSQLSTRQSS